VTIFVRIVIEKPVYAFMGKFKGLAIPTKCPYSFLFNLFAPSAKFNFSSSSVIPAEAGIQYERGSSLNKQPPVYILAGKKNGTLYIGIPSDLFKGVREHKNEMVVGFTKPREVRQLVRNEGTRP